MKLRIIILLGLFLCVAAFSQALVDPFTGTVEYAVFEGMNRTGTMTTEIRADSVDGIPVIRVRSVMRAPFMGKPTTVSSVSIVERFTGICLRYESDSEIEDGGGIKKESTVMKRDVFGVTITKTKDGKTTITNVKAADFDQVNMDSYLEKLKNPETASRIRVLNMESLKIEPPRQEYTGIEYLDVGSERFPADRFVIKEFAFAMEFFYFRGMMLRMKISFPFGEIRIEAVSMTQG